MRNPGRLLRLSFRGSRLSAAVLAGALSAVLLLSLGTGALAQGGTSVVPSGGKVAGQGYAYSLERSWQILIRSYPVNNPCQSLAANGHRVGYLGIQTLNPGTNNYNCNEPVRRPIYVWGGSAECSTIPGDHPGFGTSDSQLMQCARTVFHGAAPQQQSMTVDGHHINLKKLVTATGAFPVQIVSEKNVFNIPPTSARSAAYGSGLLLTGLSKGTHIIHRTYTVSGRRWDNTYTVQIH